MVGERGIYDQKDYQEVYEDVEMHIDAFLRNGLDFLMKRKVA